MLRDDDELNPEYDCPHCPRSFDSYSRLDEHMAEHAPLRKCGKCGKQLHNEEHHWC